MIILGIDPGFRFAGFSVIKYEKQKTYLLDYGYLSMSSSQTLVTRIGIFHDFFEEKINIWRVTDLALETPFLHKNAQNFLKLGYLRGILYLLSNKHTLNLKEFSPSEVKKSVTGYGGASKDQVARIVIQLFPGIKHPEKEDVTDALAVTLCSLWHQNMRSLM